MFIGRSFLQKRNRIVPEILARHFLVYCFTPSSGDANRMRRQGVLSDIDIGGRKQSGGVSLVRHPALFERNLTLLFMPLVGISLARTRPDVIVMNGYFSLTGLVVGLFCSLTRRPLIAIVALNPTLPYSRRKLLIYRVLLSMTARVVVLTENARKRMVSEVGLPATKVFVTQEAGVRPRAEPPVDSREVRLLYAGRLVPQKGLRYLFDAVRELRQDGVSVDTTVVGEGPLFASLERFAREKGLTNVRLVGFVRRDELDRIYSESNVFVYPSCRTRNWEEQFGYSVLEAMAKGNAVIATRCGALPEVIGEAGLYVPEKSYPALVETIRRLALDKDLLLSLRRKAAQRAMNWSLESVSEKWLLLIRATIPERRGKTRISP